MLIERESPFTGKFNTMEIDISPEQYEKWQNGEPIQNVVPNLTPDEREFLISGITPDEWDETFGNEN